MEEPLMSCGWLRKATTAVGAAVFIYAFTSWYSSPSGGNAKLPSTRDEEAEGLEAVDENQTPFDRAVSFMSNNKKVKVDTTNQLELYGLFKQANSGDCNRPKPSALDFAGVAKWDAWESKRGMSSEDAKASYVRKVGEICPDWNTSDTSPDADSGSSTNSNPGGASSAFGVGTTSTTKFSLGCETQEEEDACWQEGSDVFYFASTGDLKSLKYSIESGEDVNSQDEEHRTALHWACDRGHVEIVVELLRLGADPNLKDIDGSTPLGYAVVCEHPEIVKLLMQHGADPTIEDVDGSTPLDCASAKLKPLLVRQT